MGIRGAFVLWLAFSTFGHVVHAQDARKAAATKAQLIQDFSRTLERWNKHYVSLPPPKREALHKLAVSQAMVVGHVDLLPYLEFKVATRYRDFFRGMTAFEFLCTVRMEDDPDELETLCEPLKEQLNTLFEQVRTMRDAYKELAK